MCRRNRDGSYATQRDRERVLDLVAGQLQELGYSHMAAASLKPKHVEGLVERWQAEGLAVGTIKNRMAELRWWAEKIGKQNVIEPDNGHYGIGNRQYVTKVSKDGRPELRGATAPVRTSVCSGKRPSHPRPSTPVCASSLPGAHRMGDTGCRWTTLKRCDSRPARGGA